MPDVNSPHGGKELGTSLRKVDLNLFALFDIMMRRRSASATARELGVTASAVSHGLARLRKLLGDELFVTGPDGMQPTARALDLAPNVQDGLGKLAFALDGRRFDPAEATVTFAIAATDYGISLTLPHLIRRLATAAPHVHVRIFPFGRSDVIRQLEESRLHIVMGWFDRLPSYIHRQTLLVDHEAIVVRAGHPLTTGAVTKKRLLGFPHVVVELTGTGAHDQDGFIDDSGVVRRIWIQRLLIETNRGNSGRLGSVAVTVPNYAGVAPMLQATDMVATLPRRLARQAAERDGLVVLELPYEPLAAAHEMIWHERSLADPGARWLIEQMQAAAAEQAITTVPR